MKNKNNKTIFYEKEHKNSQFITSFSCKKVCFLQLTILLAAISSGCISKQDLYGNWYSPHGYGDSRMIYTKDYGVTFRAPDKYDSKNFVGKWQYEVKNYGLFLRVKRMSGHTDNVFNIFGFMLSDRTNYWLGFIPIFGFQYSYKISDKKMLYFLQKK